MKYFVLVPDGMADRKHPKLNNKTPMEYAWKPQMDTIAKKSLCGTVLNVPNGMVPESDTANLAILSYDPKIYSHGRSPLEAASIGIKLEPDDTAIRCNLVTVSDEDKPYEELKMVDHSSDEISTQDADILIKALNEALPMEGRKLYTGTSYRHCLVWKNANPNYNFSRPHDIPGRVIGEYLPKEENGGKEFLEFMKKGYEVLNHHPLNEERRKKGLHPANSPWLWSPGTKPQLSSFEEKWGVKGAMISAVDLLKGIAICANMDVINVEGATGNYKTNYYGKAHATIDAFMNGYDFVYCHCEGPDECGHRGEIENKVTAIERIDTEILEPVYNYLTNSGEDFKILVLPDHPTPLEIRTHSSEPVPFILYDSRKNQVGVNKFTEEENEKCPLYVADGYKLLDYMIEK